MVVLFLMFSIWPSFIPNSPVTDNGYGIITFVLFYAVGGYLKKHYETNHSKGYYFIMYTICSFITFILSIKFPKQFDHILAYDYVFNGLGLIFLFLSFTKINIKCQKIHYLSGFSFGVFLIHTNPYLRNFIYEKLLHCSLFWFSSLFPIQAII